jgi:hypothetical protein
MVKKGGAKIDNILIQEDINIDKTSNLYNTIIEILNRTDNNDNIKIISSILQDLSAIRVRTTPDDDFFSDIVKIVKRSNVSADKDDEKQGFNINIGSTSLFAKYELWNKETLQTFITIDPTIIQIMNFDNKNIENKEDIVYALKLIIRSNKILTLRFTSNLFPNNSKITKFNDLKDFNNFNLSLGNEYINTEYIKRSQLKNFLVKYINLYNFYKKCYRLENTITDDKNEVKEIKSDKFLIDYQLKYISVLGKARFKDEKIQVRCSLLTEYIITNLIFVSPTYAFISGGYKGFKESAYGITRSGYEISKKYNRPIFTIMCNEGRADSHQYSDAELIYGEHWGEDSIALSQLTDGAIIVAPFGGWTYIECLTLLANKKIVGIYNDFFNILNYNKDDDIQKENINFFKFNITEQQSILMYYINYYLILLVILNNIGREISDAEKVDILTNLKNIIISFKYLKDIIIEINKTYRGALSDISSKINDNIYNIHNVINNINELKETINTFVDTNLNLINIYYSRLFIKCKDGYQDTYQDKIPKKCNGIWIKPIFNLMDCIEEIEIRESKVTSSTRKSITRVKSISTINNYLEKFTINMDTLQTNSIFKNLNNNIIFVFSDIMHLNIYLNYNLNSINYQKQIHEKINGLMNYENISELIDEETNNSFKLSRKLDGYLNTDNEKIELQDINKIDYSFTIDYSCYNYTPLLTCTRPIKLRSVKSARSVRSATRSSSRSSAIPISGGKKQK